MTVTLQEIAGRLDADTSSLVDPAVDDIYRELKSYGEIPRADLVASVQVNLNRAIVTLREGVAPVGEQAGEHRETTRQRIDQGVPVEDIIRAYRISLRAIYKRYIEVATETDFPTRETLRGATLLWEVGDWFVGGAAAEYRYRAGSEAVRRSLARAELLRKVLLGQHHDPSTLTRLNDFGIHSEEFYAVMISHLSVSDLSSPRGPLSEILSGTPSLIAQIGQRCIGIVSSEVGLDSENSPVALGPFEPLHNITRSATMAERIWQQARDQPPGVYRLEDFGWRLAVPLETEISRHLVERYLRPIAPETRNGLEMLRTIEGLLEEGNNVRRAAERLNVHQNTLRYRVERYEALTEVSLSDLNVCFELNWALEAYKRAGDRVPFGEFYNPAT